MGPLAPPVLHFLVFFNNKDNGTDSAHQFWSSSVNCLPLTFARGVYFIGGDVTGQGRSVRSSLRKWKARNVEELGLWRCWESSSGGRVLILCFMCTHAWSPGFNLQCQEDQGFKVVLSYIVSPAWATGHPVLKKTLEKQPIMVGMFLEIQNVRLQEQVLISEEQTRTREKERFLCVEFSVFPLALPSSPFLGSCE